MSARKRQVSLHIDPGLHRRIRVLAARRGLRISDVVAEACREHLRRQKGA